MKANAPLAERQPLEDFFENGAIGLHLVAADGTILRANKAELEMLGYGPDEYVGRSIAEFHADPETIADILTRLSAGETLDKYPARLRAKDGSLRHVLISSSVCFDDDGRFVNTRCFTLDVTEKRRADEALREAQQRLAATYENAFAAIAETDDQGRFLRVNDAMRELTGYPKEALLGRSVFDMTHPDEAEVDRAQYRRQIAGEIDRYSMEKRYVRADGTLIWVHVMSSSVRHADGRFLYGVRIVHDITEGKLAEQRNRLLLNELNHRVKNTLATVQSLASHTAKGTSDVEQFMTRFEGRLLALSKAHDRLTRRNWEGASLAEIAQEELNIHGGNGRGLSVAGPDIALEPRAALALSMAFHELATNAAKYGALTSPMGRIHIRWEVSRDAHSQPTEVELEWSESGGPEVRLPTERGFGSRLLNAMAQDVEGTADLVFDPGGVRWQVRFPVHQ